MAKRLIDADALMKKAKWFYYQCDDEGTLEDSLKYIDPEDVEKAPTVDAVEVVHGEWTCDSEDGFENYDWHCSQCGGNIPYRCGNPKFTNYCPNCGAKMDGERKDK